MNLHVVGVLTASVVALLGLDLATPPRLPARRRDERGAATEFHKKIVSIEGVGPIERRYVIHMGGNLDGSVNSPLGVVAWKRAFEPNLRVTLENTGDTTVRGMWLSVNGRPWRTLKEMAAEAIRGAVTPEEKAIAVYEFITSNLGTFPSAASYFPHPLETMNSYGGALCGPKNAVAWSLWAMAGLPTREVADVGHINSEVFYEGKWHMFDVHYNFFPRLRATGEIASADDAMASPASLQPIYLGGALLDDQLSSEKLQRDWRVLFGQGWKKTPVTFDDGESSLMLPPGSRLVFDWGDPLGCVFEHSNLQEPPTDCDRAIRNGYFIHHPNLTKPSHVADFPVLENLHSTPKGLTTVDSTKWAEMESWVPLVFNPFGGHIRLTLAPQIQAQTKATEEVAAHTKEEADRLADLTGAVNEASNRLSEAKDQFTKLTHAALDETNGAVSDLRAKLRKAPATLQYLTDTRAADAEITQQKAIVDQLRQAQGEAERQQRIAQYEFEHSPAFAAQQAAVEKAEQRQQNLIEGKAELQAAIARAQKVAQLAKHHQVTVQVFSSHLGGEWTLKLERIISTKTVLRIPLAESDFLGPGGFPNAGSGLHVRVRILGGATLASYELQLTFQAARTALPGLRLGDNEVLYRANGDGPHSVRIRHEWVEALTSLPAPPPASPCEPVDGATDVAGLSLSLAWEDSPDRRGSAIAYFVRVSSRPDTKWAVSSSVDRLLEGRGGRAVAPLFRVPDGALISGRTYYWSVWRQDARGLWSRRGPVWHFTVSGPPANPQSAAPADFVR